jgi:CheY-like chemotaxis protein
MSDVPEKILVVDDDEFTAEMTGMFLEMAGYETIIAIGGMDALDKIGTDPEIRMVLSDMNMPFMDGIQLFDELRGQGFTQPFVLLTGEESAPLKLAHPNLDAVLTKNEELQDKLPELVAELLARC